MNWINQVEFVLMCMESGEDEAQHNPLSDQRKSRQRVSIFHTLYDILPNEFCSRTIQIRIKGVLRAMRCASVLKYR